MLSLILPLWAASSLIRESRVCLPLSEDVAERREAGGVVPSPHNKSAPPLLQKAVVERRMIVL